MYTKNILLWKYLVENKYEKKKLKKWLPNKGLIEITYLQRFQDILLKIRYLSKKFKNKYDHLIIVLWLINKLNSILLVHNHLKIDDMTSY